MDLPNLCVPFLCLADQVDELLVVHGMHNAGEVYDLGDTSQLDFGLVNLGEGLEVGFPLRILLLKHLVADEDRVEAEKSLLMLKHIDKLHHAQRLL